MAGALPLRDLETLIGEVLPEEGVSTVSGWVTHRLGGFAKVGDRLKIGAFELEVTEMDGPIAAQLKLTRAEEPAIKTEGS